MGSDREGRGNFRLAKTERHSLSFIMEFLFSGLSGFGVRPDKSSILTCGVNDSVKDPIICNLSYNAGSLPIRYLGVPLSSFVGLSFSSS